ncbi:MAG: ABC transporter ATP-binding protein [Leptonema sp. (in: bacteria)]
MIEIVDLYLKQKSFELKNISLNIKKCTIHTIIGPTGCGKTTLLEAVIGLRKIEKGKIYREGEDITKLPIYKRKFSYVPQDLSIFPHLTVMENLLFGIQYSQLPNKKERVKETLEIAKYMKIEHLLSRKAILLSGGEKQRISLARALAPGYSYLFLDEPFAGLHEGIKKELYFLLKEIQKRYELTIVMVTHDLEEAFFLSDYISVMINGKILHTDEKEKIYSNPKYIEVANYFAIKNIFEGEIVDISGEILKIYCDSFKKEILVPKDKLNKPSVKQKLYFGIRKEDIMILREDLPNKDNNILQGIVKEIFFLGSKFIVLVQTNEFTKKIEISLPEYAFKKLALKTNQHIKISLRKERIFILS